MNPKLLEILQCPKCSSKLSLRGDGILCDSCQTTFQVTKDGIPILLDDTSDFIEETHKHQFDKISEFYDTINEPLSNAVRDISQKNFFKNLSGSSVLDVGNGGETPLSC